MLSTCFGQTRKPFPYNQLRLEILFFSMLMSAFFWVQDTQIGRKLSENSIFFDALGVWGAGDGGGHSF
jgi:hypothetical protein